MEETADAVLDEFDRWATRSAVKIGFGIVVGAVVACGTVYGLNKAESYFVRRYNKRQMKVVTAEFGPCEEEAEKN